VAVDAVEGMVMEASRKVKVDPRVSVAVMDAHQLRFPIQSFDTVVDTFGLCSYADPVLVLQEMKRVCKPNGRILLIEHGEGHYNWMNKILDNGACAHAHNWGCIWTQDLMKLIEKASGLEVVSLSRFHFGTTYLIELKVNALLGNTDGIIMSEPILPPAPPSGKEGIIIDPKSG
jgi:methyltransferase OMS1